MASTETGGYRLIAGIAGTLFDMPIVPAPVIAATDSRSMSLVADDIYRFQPVVLSLEQTGMLHGADEHIELTQFAGMITFFQSLMLGGSAPNLP